MDEKINYDFRTPLQKRQEERRRRILTMFAEYREKTTAETSDYRIMMVVAERVGCTPQNVRATLIRANVIKPKHRYVIKRN